MGPGGGGGAIGAGGGGLGAHAASMATKPVISRGRVNLSTIFLQLVVGRTEQ